MTVTPLEAYRLWAASYDVTPNPLLALEERVLAGRLDLVRGLRILDAGCGTGRWMSRLAAQGADVFGIDRCDSMIVKAAAKASLSGRCVVADLDRIPAADSSFDLALCSFTLSYATGLDAPLQELARLARVVIVTDLHPEAGWSRSFRANGSVWEIEHSTWSEEQIDRSAHAAGLTRAWRVAAPFGEPEREIFVQAGKEALFAEVEGVPAVLITAFERKAIQPKTWTKSFS
jgi:malonyl-CoA O-methyltransferase